MNLEKETNENYLKDILQKTFEDKDKIIINENSIAEGLGIARARDVLNENYNIVSVIESNNISFGTIMESLENVGENKTKMIVVLKDILEKNSKNNIIQKIIKKWKNKSEGMSLFKSYFESLGFKYVGPLEEKNEDKIEKALEGSKSNSKPTLIHIVSKAKGEEINIEENKQLEFFDEKLLEIAKENEKLAIINFKDKSFSRTQEEIPNRFFNVSKNNNKNEIDSIIGMAKTGLIPIVIMGSDKVKEDYEKIISKVANKDLPIVFLLINNTRDEIYSASFDIPYLSTLAGLTVMNSKNIEEASKMLEFAIKLGKASVIKVSSIDADTEICRKIKLGKAEMLKEGRDLTIVASGNCVNKAIEIDKMLDNSGIEAEIINARFIKPIDREMIEKSIEKTRFLVTLEDNYLSGGMGLNINSMLENEVKILNIGYNDEALKELQDTKDDLLDEEKIYKKIVKSLEEESNPTNEELRVYNSKEEVV